MNLQVPMFKIYSIQAADLGFFFTGPDGNLPE